MIQLIGGTFGMLKEEYHFTRILQPFIQRHLLTPRKSLGNFTQFVLLSPIEKNHQATVADVKYATRH